MSSRSLEFYFHISLKIISSFFSFSSAVDFSVNVAIAIEDLAEFSLLLIDSMFRVFALFALSSSSNTSFEQYLVFYCKNIKSIMTMTIFSLHYIILHFLFLYQRLPYKTRNKRSETLQ